MQTYALVSTACTLTLQVCVCLVYLLYLLYADLCDLCFIDKCSAMCNYAIVSECSFSAEVG